MINETIDRDKLLDNFPLNERELDLLLRFYHKVSVESTDLPLSVICSEVVETSKAETETHIDTENRRWSSAVSYVESVILCEISSQWFHKATEWVSPLLPYDVDSSGEFAKIFFFMEAVVSLLGRRGGARFLPNFVFDTIVTAHPDEDHRSTAATADALALVDFVYRHVRATWFIQCSCSLLSENNDEKESHFLQLQALDPPSAWVESLKQTVGGSSDITRAAWNEWVNDIIPEAMRCFSTLYHYILFSPSHPFGPSHPQQFTLPQPDKKHHLWGHSSDALPLTLACISPVFRGRWYHIYSSNFDGLSFLTFRTAILGYPGPMVLLVRRKESAGVFGFYSDCPWKESNEWFGDDGNESFLFKVEPSSLAVYYPTYESSNGHYMYLHNNTLSITNGSNSLPRGLAIGGIASDTPRVHLTTSFENCTATAIDTTYASGSLIDAQAGEDIVPPSFDVDVIEAWAVNVTEEEFSDNKIAGEKQIANRESARQKVAQVDRAQFLDDFQSGAVMNNLYVHRQEARGRHDFVASQDGSGYFLEDKQPSSRKLLDGVDKDDS